MSYTMKEYYSGRKRWAVYKPDSEMLCVCLYKKGAIALVNHLNEITGCTLSKGLSKICIDGKTFNFAYNPITKKGESK